MRRPERRIALAAAAAAAALTPAAAAPQPLEAPLLESAAWALASDLPRICAERPGFEDCSDPWGAARAWRYGAANALAASGLGAEGVRKDAARVAKSVRSFFRKPDAEAFARAAERASGLLRSLREGSAGLAFAPRSRLADMGIPEHASSLGVPFPLVSVWLPAALPEATLQLRGGMPMPLLALATRKGGRPSQAGILEALRLGVRHLEVSPGSAQVAGLAIQRSEVRRKLLFLSVPWELPLASEESLDVLLSALGTRYVDLVQLPRGPDAAAAWRLLEKLKAKGKVRALGARGFPAEELDGGVLPGGPAGGGPPPSLEYAQCAFTPYQPGPTRATWRTLGRHGVALAGSSLLTNWPHALRPVADPHVAAVAGRVGRSPAQVLIRWALQLGVAVVFRAEQAQHIAENVHVLDFSLPEQEMLLLNSLATLWDPATPPGDGFAHAYAPPILESRPARGEEPVPPRDPREL